MNKLACEMCGSTNLVKEEGLYVCQSCGAKYSPEEAKKMMVEGTVKVDTSSELENLKKLAKRYYGNRDFIKADEYYDKILELDSDDYEAVFFKGMISAMKSNFLNPYHDYFDGYPDLVSAYRDSLDILDDKNLDENDEIKAKFAIEAHNQISFAVDTFYNHEGMDISDFQEGYKEGKGEFVISRRRLTNYMLEMCDYDNGIYLILTSKSSKNKGNVKKAKIDILDAQIKWLSFVSKHNSNISETGIFGDRVNEIKKLEPNYNPPELKSGGCYIATSVYGSYDCPEVWTLRRFRDDKLSNTLHGRLFVKIYYIFSPTLVKYFGNKKLFKKLFKSRLDKLVEKLQEEGFESIYYEGV